MKRPLTCPLERETQLTLGESLTPANCMRLSDALDERNISVTNCHLVTQDNPFSYHRLVCYVLSL